MPRPTDPDQRIADLDDVVLQALDLHSSYEIPALHLGPARRRLVVASGNALPTGRIVFAGEPATFASESLYGAELDRNPDIDRAVVISASGTKHAPIVIEDLIRRRLDPHLITCDPSSPAARLLAPDRVTATRSLPEPLTYNTSTYLGMILSKTREDPAAIKRFILDEIRPALPDLARYGAFYLLLRPSFEVQREMFVTKFDELFGGRIAGRCYTTEQTLHAKTVVPWEKELFVAFGCDNEHFGTARLSLPLPETAGFGQMMAVGYYVVGRIQKAMPPWFKQQVGVYERLQRQLFAERPGS